MTALEKKAAAKLVDLAKKGAALTGGKHGAMCNSCAFKKGSVTNTSEPHNTSKALECVAYFGTFHCHTRGTDNKLKDAGRVCAGFKYAMAYLNNNET